MPRTKKVKKEEVSVEMQDHIVTEEDLKNNPGLEKDVKVGETIQIPVEATGFKKQGMSKVSHNFKRADLNEMRDKVNELIEIENSK